MQISNKQLNAFVRLIVEDATAENNARQSALKKENDKAMKAAEDRFLEEAYSEIRAEAHRVKTENAAELQAAAAENRRKLAARREEMKGEIMAAAQRQYAEFQKTGEYRDSLEKMAESAACLFEGEAVSVFLRGEDMDMEARLRPLFSGESRFVSDGGVSGGLVVSGRQGRLVCDMSVDAALEEISERFSHYAALDT